jgi:maltose alpha-D-glucosyltransferase/alpha-amylase
MQWSDGQNTGFSTAEKDQLYLPLDPRKNRPTVKKQTSDPGSLLNHVRDLIALRRCSPALQADGTLIPLPVENNDHHFAYLRQATGERFLIVLNPSAQPSITRIKGIETDNLISQICHGTQACIEGDDIQIKLEGVSYGIFKL